MERSFIVVDGFYPDPEKVRAEALAHDYAQHRRGAHRSASKEDGYNGSIAQIPTARKRRLMDRLKGIVGATSITFDTDKVADFKVLTRAQFERKTSRVHIDLHDWSGVLSLSPPRKELSFTTFWYHPKLRLDGFHDLDAVSDACARRRCTLEQLGDVLGRDSNDLTRWVETTRIQHVFNRLILFRGNLFHSSSDGFGSRIANAKLTQTFFFDVPPGRVDGASTRPSTQRRRTPSK